MLNGTRVIDDRSHLFFKNQSHLRLSWKVMRVLQLGNRAMTWRSPELAPERRSAIGVCRTEAREILLDANVLRSDRQMVNGPL
jgi:hypothetical protein